MKGRPIPGIGTVPEFTEAVFNLAAGRVASEPVKTDKGFHVILVRERTPERQRPLEEVQQQVFQELRSMKEREVEQQLMNRLRDEYNVVIHHSRFKTTEETE